VKRLQRNLYLLSILFVARSAFAIIDGQDAADLLGELNSSDQPAYTKKAVYPPAATGAPNNAVSNRGVRAPTGVAIDTAGHRLFVADYGNHRVLVYNLDANNNLINRVADNVLGQPDLDTLSPGTSATQMWYPRTVAYDAGGKRLFVVETYTAGNEGNNRVLVFNVSSIIDGQAAVAVLGQPDFTTRNTGTAQNVFSSPLDAAYDPNTSRLYVADFGNNRVLVFNAAGSISNGQNAAAVLGEADFTTGTSGLSQSQMNSPSSVAFDPVNNRLFVADLGNNRVLIFNGMAGSIANGRNADLVLGQPNFSSNAAAASQAGLSGPSGLAYDASNQRLYVADYQNNRVLLQSVAPGSVANGQNAANVFGQSSFTTNTAATTQSGLDTPAGLAFNPSNSQLYISDFNNNRAVVQNTSSISNGQNAVDLLGELNASDAAAFSKNGVNNGPNNRGLYNPQATLIDPDGHRLFVADSHNNRVLVYNLTSANLLIDHIADNVLGQTSLDGQAAGAGPNGMNLPLGLALDRTNQRLFVSDAQNNRVLIFSIASISDGQSAVNVLGQSNFSSNSAALSQAGLNFPLGLNYDAGSQRLFIADFNNNRVVMQSLSASIANGQNASAVLGQSNFTTNNLVVSQSGMIAPADTVYDSTNTRLFVADAFDNRVLVFNNMSGTVANGRPADNVLGQANFTTGTPGIGKNKFNFPRSLAYYPPENILFASDYNNNRILAFFLSAAVTNGQNADNVLGQTDFTSNGSATTQNGLFGPGGATAFAGAETNFYAVDIQNHRLMQFNFPRPAPPAAPRSGFISAVTTSTLSAVWQAAATALSYNLVVSTLSSNPPAAISASSATASLFATVPSLAFNTTYFAFVNACNALGCSTYTAVGSSATLANAPVSLRPTSVGATSIAVAWDGDGNPAGTTYVIELSPDGVAFSASFTTTSTSFNLTGLQNSFTYFIRVRARNYGGILTSPSNTIEVTTGGAPWPPASGNILAVSETALTAAWAPSFGTSYTLAVAYDPANPPTSIAASSSTALTTATVQGLTPNTTVYAFADACNQFGCSTFTALGSSITFANPPLTLSTTSVGTTSISLVWNANQNPNGTTYLVDLSLDGVAFSNTFSTGSVNFTFSNLAQNFTYTIHVRAKSFGGVVTHPSNTIVVTTSGGGGLFSSLSAPVNLNGQSGGGSVQSSGPQLTYTWNPVDVPSGVAVQYEIFSSNDLFSSVDNWTLVGSTTDTRFGPVGAGGTPIYTCVKAAAQGHLSACSTYIDNGLTPHYVYPSSDKKSFASIIPQGQLLGVGGALYKAVIDPPAGSSQDGIAYDIQVVNAQTGAAQSPYQFNPPATMVIHTTVEGLGKKLHVEYFNGANWVLTGEATYDPDTKTIEYSISRSGVYRISNGGGSGVLRNVYPRIFSPNGDGRNDVVLFQLNNSGNQSVGGTIFDMDAARVADLKDGPVQGLSLIWDGKDSSGKTVRGGVYLYQITVGSDRVNGTVVVVQ